MRSSNFHRALVTCTAAVASVLMLSGCTLVSTLAAAGEDPLPTADPTSTAEPDATSTPTPTPTATVAGAPTDFFNLKPGDCFDINEAGSGALLYPSCEPPHLYEAYSVFSMPGEATFPGDDAVDDFAYTSCLDAFTAFVGSTYSQSSFEFEWIKPSKGTWETMSDREILCSVTPSDGVATTGSAKDSRR